MAPVKIQIEVAIACAEAVAACVEDAISQMVVVTAHTEIATSYAAPTAIDMKTATSHMEDASDDTEVTIACAEATMSCMAPVIVRVEGTF